MKKLRELPEPYFCGDCGARLWETMPDDRQPSIRGTVACPNRCVTEVGAVDANGKPADMNTVLG